MPLFRRLPKRGFNNANFTIRYSVVNVGDLQECFDTGEHVTTAAMIEAGLVRNKRLPVKILGDGELKKKLNVEAHRFSKQAAEKISAVGGQANTVSRTSRGGDKN